MSINHRKLALLLGLSILLSQGCAERKEMNEPEAHSEDWSNPSSPNFHGTKVALTGLISCSTCHGTDYRGGTSGVSCYTCHNGPGGHPAGWLDSTAQTFHGRKVAAKGPQSCAPCHGPDYRGKKGVGGSCYACHNGPSGHPAEGWLDKSKNNFHGLAAIIRGIDECAPCHGADFRGKEGNGVSCYKCHNGPSGHPAEGWLDKSSQSFHGLAASSRSLSFCAICHGSDFNGGSSGVSCKSCHTTLGGHPIQGFLTPDSPEFHGKRLLETGFSYCAGCHGNDFKGGASGISCYTCHNGPGGHPAEGWLSEASRNFHGLAASSRGLSSCAVCHGSDFNGGISGVSCKTCHPTQSGHPSAGWLDPSQNGFHGVRLAQAGLGYCSGCHGSDYRGGVAGVSCYTCHNGPSGHPEAGWLDKTSNLFHGLAASRRGLPACAACHGQDFSGGLAGVSCKTCHASKSGHPSAGWMDSSSASFHGRRLAETSLTYCAGCHGKDYKGGDAGVSCYTCHDGPGGHPKTGWLNRLDPKFHGFAASARGLNTCAACHGQDFNGGLSGVSCKACHTTLGGHPSKGWLVPGNPLFHGVRVSQTGTAYCAGCHGSDYKGGVAGISCFTCHNGPSGHPNGWLDENNPNFHGTKVEKEGATGCAACHGASFDGGISGLACSECHAYP